MTEPSRAIVYIVDDDTLVLATTADALSDYGYDIRTFSSPVAFLESLDPNVSGCLVVDLKMPELSGIEVLAQLRQRGARIRTILLSGQGDVGRAVAALQAGAMDFVEKPFRPDRLVASVERAIAASRQDEAATELVRSQTVIASLESSDRELLTAAGSGESLAQTAARVGLDEAAIKLAWDRILTRLGVPDVESAIRIAQRAGLIRSR